MRKSVIAIIITMLLTVCAFAQTKTTRNSSQVKTEQKELNKQIKKTQNDIDANQKRILNQLNQLNSLNSIIEHTSNNIAEINKNINRLAAEEKRLTDSIEVISSEVDILKKECSKLLRDSRKRKQSMSELSLVFSSDNFIQAMKRAAYIKQLNKHAADKQKQLLLRQKQLLDNRVALAKVKEQQTELALSLSHENEVLKEKQAQSQVLLGQLQGEASALASALAEQQKKARALDAELDRIIAEEARQAEERRLAEERRKAEEKRKAEEQRKLEEERKAEEQRKNKETTKKKDDKKGKDQSNKSETMPEKTTQQPTTKPKTENRELTQNAPETADNLTGTFAQNKGKLLFPVSGRYNIVSRFGVNTHKDLPEVKTENSGIDIEATAGSKARAVYNGVVSSIFYLDGYHNIVMVRHGEYLTVYANIDALSVKKGDKVKTGQVLGQIYSDPSDNNRTVLHFEVRKETQKLDPLQWVKR